MLSKFFKKVEALVGSGLSFNSDKPAKAAVGSAFYVAKSGGMSDEEYNTMVEQLRGNPRFADVDLNNIISFWEDYKSDRLFRRDLFALLEEIRDTTDKAIREDIAITAIEVADSEGNEGDSSNIDEDEMARLEEIGKAININIKEHI